MRERFLLKNFICIGHQIGFRTNCGQPLSARTWEASHSKYFGIILLLKRKKSYDKENNIFHLQRPGLQELHASESARQNEGHWPKRG